MNGRPSWLPVLSLLVAAILPPAWGREADEALPMVEGLSASLHTAIPLPRPNAPWPIEVSLNHHGSAPRTGTLSVSVREGNRTVCRWMSDERVLVSGVTTFPILLPPMDLDSEHDQLSCAMQWQEHGSSLDLGRVIEPMSNGAHLLHLALCMPLGASEPAKLVQRQLALEFHQRRVEEEDGTPHPADRAQDQDRPRLRTVPVHMSEEECPETALAWCAYDVAVIVGDRLQALKSRHIAALEQWVLAGGSCCLVSAGDLPAGISDLVSRANLADGGRADLSAPGHVRLRHGLGRIVVVRQAAPPHDQEAEDAPDWAASAAFLWKMRKDVADGYARTGSWDIVQNATPSAMGQASHNWSYAARLELGIGIYQLLWPTQVHAVPLLLVLTVFVTFILMIGPGEWFLLGWLRARRFTWVVFPVLAIGCTCSMVWISRHFLGGDDLHERLEVVDIGPGGQLLRRNRCELIFTGATKDIVDDVHDALHCPLRIDQLAQYRGPRQLGSYSMTYRGNLPGRYTVAQTIQQWSPKLIRELSLSAEPLPWLPDLDGIRRLDDVAACALRWIGAGADHAAVVLIRRGAATALWGDKQVLAQFLSVERQGRQDFFQQINSHPKTGWFSLFSAMSPAGGSLFDDLPVLDDSDPGEFAIVCLQHRDKSWWLVRRVFHIAPGDPGTTK